MKFEAPVLVLLLFAGAADGVAQEAETEPPAPLDTRVVVSGYLQADARQGESGELPDSPSHELNLRRARVGVSGKVTRALSYNLVLQGDGGNANSASLVDASIDLALTPSLKVRAGQFKYDFDIEGRESAHAIPMIDRPFVTNAIAGGLNGASTASSPSGSFRDRGVSLIGQIDQRVRWGYSAGLFQGSGRAADNNGDWSATAALRVEPRSGLHLNLGFLDSETANEGAPSAGWSAWTAGGSWERNRLFIRAEAYRGRRSSTAISQDLDGYYLTGVFTLAPALDLSGRFQRVDDGQFAGKASASSIDLGVKWFFVRRDGRSGTFVSLNYMNRDADAGFSRGLTLLNDGRGAALTDGRDAGGVLAARLQVRF